jgi:REP element-mobilizing transposase RayT
LCSGAPTMSRGARLDAPETLHHVMVRRIERTPIFFADADRADFGARLAMLTEVGALTVYAWSLLPNHAHLLVRTGTRPLHRSLRSLLTGYAGAFNRRHHRVGHLFQNRYKSIVVVEEPYLLELVRYLRLNPLRATGVPDLRAQARYPWTGHRALVGPVARPRQATQTILAPCGPPAARARRARRVPSGGVRRRDLGRAHGRSVGRRVPTVAVIANVVRSVVLARDLRWCVLPPLMAFSGRRVPARQDGSHPGSCSGFRVQNGRVAS